MTFPTPTGAHRFPRDDARHRTALGRKEACAGRSMPRRARIGTLKGDPLAYLRRLSRDRGEARSGIAVLSDQEGGRRDPELHRSPVARIVNVRRGWEDRWTRLKGRAGSILQGSCQINTVSEAYAGRSVGSPLNRRPPPAWRGRRRMPGGLSAPP